MLTWLGYNPSANCINNHVVFKQVMVLNIKVSHTTFCNLKDIFKEHKIFFIEKYPNVRFIYFFNSKVEVNTFPPLDKF